MKRIIIIAITALLSLLMLNSCECSHTFEIIEAIEPTCTKEGATAGTFCTKCGKYGKEPQTVKATGHDFREESNTATCTEGGIIVNICKICKETSETKSEPLGHNYVKEQTKKPTCTEKGLNTFTCSRCNDSYTAEVDMISHDYSKATCTTPATCKTCGATKGTTAEHDYDSRGICKVCGADNYKTITVNGVNFKVQNTPLVIKGSFGGKAASLQFNDINITFERTYSSYSRFYIVTAYEKLSGGDNEPVFMYYTLYDEDDYVLGADSLYTEYLSPGAKVRDKTLTSIQLEI